jgi:transglutaminase-like putative cysteine protease
MLLRILVFVCVLATAALADSDRWYVVEMMGKRAGRMHAAETRSGETITTTTSVTFELKRGDVGIAVTMNGEFVETSDGKPVSMKSVQKMAQSEVVTTVRFVDGGAEITTTQSGNSTTRKQSIEDTTWLTPAAADRYVTQRFKSGAKEIVVRTIDPTSGVKVVTSTRAVGEKATTRAMGREIEAVRCVVETSVAPGIKTTEYVDAEGVMVRSETMMGGIPIVMIAATAEEASAAVEEAAPEMFRSTFIKPERPIKNARTLQRGVYLVSVKDGQLPDFPATGSQTTEPVSPTSARVTVVADTFAPAPEADATNPEFLASTTACSTTDERIVELAARAVKDLPEGASAAEKAEACRAYTFKFIKKKSLGVGFATASEVARTREGDCSEHGVFLAAMLRANGVPARVVAGLVYADGFAGEEAIFGYHMWTQALLEKDGVKRWVDLDGTLGPTVPYDATHLTLALSSLGDDEGMESMLSIAQALGRLAVKVEETSP